MAQTPSLTTDDSPRPLPRRERPSPARTTRPRLQPLDGLWIALLAGLAAVIYGLLPHKHLNLLLVPSITAALVNIALVYLLGWRLRDRATAVVGGLLLATSIPFLQGAAISPEAAILAALTVGSLLAFVADFSLAALMLGGLATMIQPTDALLGIVLLLFSFAQHRRRAIAGAILFFLIAFGGNGLMLILGKGSLPTLHWSASAHLGLPGWLAAPTSSFLLWFLLPFLGEWTDRARRSRWLPLVVWLILGSLAASVLHTGNTSANTLSFLPLFLLMVACGFSRLLPLLAGEFASLPVRYGVATVSALALVALRIPQEWRQVNLPPTSHTSSVTPISPPVITPAPQPPPILPKPDVSSAVKNREVTPPIKKSSAHIKPLKKKRAKPLPKPIQAHKTVNHLTRRPAMRSYLFRNGHRALRSRWSVNWHRNPTYRR